jgi:hypothetical protein
MGISWELEFFLKIGSAGKAGLLTNLARHPVNVVEACQLAEGRFLPQRIQFDVAGVSLSSISASKLTVPHKTVAEAL